MAKAKKPVAKSRGGAKTAPKKMKRKVVYVITDCADMEWVGVVERKLEAHDVRLVEHAVLVLDDADVVVFMSRDKLHDANRFQQDHPDPELRVVMLTGGLRSNQRLKEGIILGEKTSNEITKEILGE